MQLFSLAQTVEAPRSHMICNERDAFFEDFGISSLRNAVVSTCFVREISLNELDVSSGGVRYIAVGVVVLSPLTIMTDIVTLHSS
jgi:hypothetical protein